MSTTSTSLSSRTATIVVKRRALVILSATALVLTLSGFWSLTRAEVTLESRVKAGYLYNFLRHITWPKSSFRDAKAPLVVGILGNNELAAVLKAATRRKALRGRKILGKKIANSDDAMHCHIVFVSEERRDLDRTIIQALRGKPVLTVGEHSGFTAAGGMVHFHRSRNKVRFAMQLSRTKSAGLKVSARLVKLASRDSN